MEDESGLNSHDLAEIHSETLSPKKEKRNKSSIFYLNKQFTREETNMAKQTVEKVLHIVDHQKTMNRRHSYLVTNIFKRRRKNSAYVDDEGV